MQEVTTINNEKMFFKYLLNKNQFKYDSFIFNHIDIKRTYEYVKQYFSEYNNLPQPIIISEALDIKIGIINTLFNLDELNNYDDKWLKDNFETYYKKSFVNHEVSKLVTDVREGNIDKIYDKLNLKTETEETEEEFDYKTHTKNEIKTYNNMLGKAPVEKIFGELIEEYNSDEIYIDCKYLFYPILKEGQLGMLFGKSGEGKSILAVEMANFIAKGKCDWEIFRVDTEPQDVVYIDFELGASSFQSRYKKSKIDNRLHILNVKLYQYNNYIGFDKKNSDRLERAINLIEQAAIKYNSKVIFIDNLSNIADQVEQAAEASRFIMDLYGRAKSLDLTLMFVGHTPKISVGSTISINQLKGSSSLANVFESIIGFRKSKDNNISYIKQVKHRGLDPIFSDDIAKFEFDMNGKDGWTLNYIGEDVEDDIMPVVDKDGRSKNSKMKYTNDVIVKVLYDCLVNKTSERLVAEKFSIPKSSVNQFKIYLKNDVNGLFNDYEKYCIEQKQFLEYQQKNYGVSSNEIEELFGK